MINLVALPCLCVDVFDGTDELRAGGEALNFAVHSSKFEQINVSLLGAVGQDSYAEFIMNSISDKKINVSHVRVEKDMVTANNRTYLTEDGDRYYKEDSWTGDIVDKMILNPDELEMVKASDVVFVHFWAGCFGQIIDLKKHNDFKLAVDFVEYRDFEDMEKYAPYIDYFMISGEESLLPIFEDWSKKYTGLFNMSLADKGSVTYNNGKSYYVPAKDVKVIVDTTGCGDSYHAGFVCSHMMNEDIYEAMRIGTEFATETLSHFGGF
ncbi:MAG: PfkB family carbohydrate kinase [Lachnospiraceae bacterium]|nr:PfkB family carbohydrate kinase [Lachnospiraceae bacterium]